jgi:hypothetical protein
MGDLSFGPIQNRLLRSKGRLLSVYVLYLYIGLQVGTLRSLGVNNRALQMKSKFRREYGGYVHYVRSYAEKRQTMLCTVHILFFSGIAGKFFVLLLKVHKLEIFFVVFFCRNRNLIVPRACNTRFLKIVFDSADIFDF